MEYLHYLSRVQAFRGIVGVGATAAPHFFKHIQSWTFAYIRLLNKPYENELTLRGQNICLKCYQPLKLMLYFGKGLRSFHTGNIGSVGQRASKLLAVKVGGLKKKSLPPSPGPTRTSRPGFEIARGRIILKV